MTKRPLGSSGYVLGALGVGALTLLLVPFRDQINSTTVALTFLLVVLLAATLLGSRPALLASLLAAFSLNFFFLRPYYTLTIAEPQNWISLIVFLCVAVTVGYLSAQARQRAEVAESLYKELEDAFEQASEAEALRRSEKLKSSLLDAVTHDIRTPLTSIKAATTMLLEEQTAVHTTLDEAGHRDLLEVIDEETDRLNSFVESMIDLAQLEAGVPLPRKPVDPESIVISALQRASRITSSRISIRHGTSGPDLIVAPKALAEALFNLVENAAKYSPPGSEIVVGYQRGTGNTTFFVDDDGPGIPVSRRDSVFEKFSRADDSAKGFGMGLSIVKGIVEAHGGRVWIEDLAKGTRFAFEIPNG